MKSNLKRFISYALCFVLLLGCIVFPSSPVADASVLDDLKQAGEELAQKIEQNKEKLDSLKSDKSNQEEYLQTLETNIQYTQNQLDNLNNQIDVIESQIKEVETTVKNLEAEIEKLNSEISSTDSKIKQAEKNVKTSYNNLSSRLRSSYISGNDSNLKLLLGADNIATFLRRLELMKLISENDAKLINDFKAEAEVLELSKSSLEERTVLLDQKKQTIKEENQVLYAKRNELTSKRASLNSTSLSLESQYAEVQNTIATLDRNSAYYQNLILKQQQEEEENERAIEAYIAAHASTGNGGSGDVSVGTGKFMFPLRYSGVHVTSGFGWRTIYGQSNYHGGIDLSASGIYGQNIYASRAGTVILADSSCSTTYGKYIIIDHGDGYTTVYAHASALLVSQGQRVNQGDVIARVGSTGRSTGPHLHFEVRYNGERQNPLNYVTVG
ncbi:MAG: murein hydrolase activator EnvC family protein [Acutalibacteraceae bacterium]